MKKVFLTSLVTAMVVLVIGLSWAEEVQPVGSGEPVITETPANPTPETPPAPPEAKPEGWKAEARSDEVSALAEKYGVEPAVVETLKKNLKTAEYDKGWWGLVGAELSLAKQAGVDPLKIQELHNQEGVPLPKLSRAATIAEKTGQPFEAVVSDARTMTLKELSAKYNVPQKDLVQASRKIMKTRKQEFRQARKEYKKELREQKKENRQERQEKRQERRQERREKMQERRQNK